jgi:hypothetical protein
MDDLQIVTIAPGESIVISPHPSGLPLPPLRLQAGDTLRVPHAESLRLYVAGKTLGPNGQPRPKPAVPDYERPRIHRGYGFAPDIDGIIAVGDGARGNAAALEEYDRQREADRASPGMARGVPRSPIT